MYNDELVAKIKLCKSQVEKLAKPDCKIGARGEVVLIYRCMMRFNDALYLATKDTDIIEVRKLVDKFAWYMTRFSVEGVKGGADIIGQLQEMVIGWCDGDTD
jgi:hypothetical protein